MQREKTSLFEKNPLFCKIIYTVHVRMNLLEAWKQGRDDKVTHAPTHTQGMTSNAVVLLTWSLQSLTNLICQWVSSTCACMSALSPWQPSCLGSIANDCTVDTTHTHRHTHTDTHTQTHRHTHTHTETHAQIYTYMHTNKFCAFKILGRHVLSNQNYEVADWFMEKWNSMQKLIWLCRS